MRVVVEVESGPRVGGRWLLRPGDQMTFGRTERADIIIAEDPILSSCHFRVVVDRETCTIEDMDSTNGTWIADQRISAAPVKDGDRIKAGNSIFVFQVDARDAYKRTTDDAHARIRSQTTFPEPTKSRSPEPREIPESREHSSPAARPKPIETAAPIDRIPDPKPPERVSPDHHPPDHHPIERSSNLTSPTGSTRDTSSTAPAAPKKTASPVEPLPRSPKRTEPVQSMPRDLTIALSLCGSGLWRGEQVSPVAEPLLMLELLTRSLRPIFVIDFARTGLSRGELADDQPPSYLMANLPPEAAAIVSPRMLRSSDFEQRATWISDGWGSDGMTVVLSHVDVAPMLDHFHRMMKSGPASGDSNRGVLGLCWPSVLEAMLSDGKEKFVNDLMEPCEAILLDSPDAPGGWALFGDHRLPELLVSCQIPQTVLEENPTPPLDNPQD